jgi:hypothetical protein
VRLAFEVALVGVVHQVAEGHEQDVGFEIGGRWAEVEGLVVHDAKTSGGCRQGGLDALGIAELEDHVGLLLDDRFDAEDAG